MSLRYSLITEYDSYIQAICKRKLKRLIRKGMAVLIPDAISVTDHYSYALHQDYKWKACFAFNLNEDIYEKYVNLPKKNYDIAFCASIAGRNYFTDEEIVTLSNHFFKKMEKTRGYKHDYLILMFKTRNEAIRFKLKN